MYDPIGGIQAIKQFYLSYLETAFRIDQRGVSSARRKLLEGHGTLALDPILELVPRYAQSKHRIEDLAGRFGERVLAGFSPESRIAFVELVLSGLFDGVEVAGGTTRFASRYRPYKHQIRMLRRGLTDGSPGIVTSGTGSGKTESFMLPLIAAIVAEARNWPAGVPTGNNWFDRGDFVGQRSQEPASRPKAVRALILYPMNALVEDQMVRLRKALDSEAARETMRLRLNGNRIFFARYTGKTPVTGFERHPRLFDDEGWKGRRKRRRDELRDQMRDMARTQEAVRRSDAERLQADPTSSPDRFLFPSVDGNELVSRWDIQATPPDVLVTNYSILNAILVREVDAPILDETRKWLAARDDARFHLVMDELHLVRGSGGAEIAGLLRTLVQRLGLDRPEHRHKLRVLASSASLPVDDDLIGDASMRFLWDMFGSAGTFAGPGAPGALSPSDWRSAVVGGDPVAWADPPGLPDRTAMAALARCAHTGICSTGFRQALAAAVCSLSGSGRLDRGASETAVRRAAEHLARACSIHPEHLERMAVVLFGDPDVDALRGLTIVRALPEIAAQCLDEVDRPSGAALEGIPSFRMHAFFRSIEGLFASLCLDDAVAVWGSPSVERGEAFDRDEGDGRRRRRFEMLYCESCGELFAGGRRGAGENGRENPTAISLLPAPQDLESLPESAASGRFEDSSYSDYALFWPSVAPVQGGDDLDPAYAWRCGNLDPFSGVIVEPPGQDYVPGYVLRRRKRDDAPDKHGRQAHAPATAVPYCCPRCGTDYSPRFKAANSQRREGRLSPIRSFRTGFGKTSQLLASELVASLRAQGGDGKLVAFSDSRQDAASLALNVETQHQRDLHRELLVEAAHQRAWGDKPDEAELDGLLARRAEAAAVLPDPDFDAIAALHPKIKALEKRLAEANQPPSVPLADLLEFERGAPPDGMLRPVLDRLIGLGANPAAGADLGKLANRDWHLFFDRSPAAHRWRQGRNEKELQWIRRAKDQVLAEQKPDATDLLFSRTYFAIEETGLGWPSFFKRTAYGEAESLKDAWLRVFGDAYRILPNRYMDEADAKPWRTFGDIRNVRVNNLLRLVCRQPEQAFDDFLQWIAAEGRGHLDGRIDVAQLYFRPADDAASFWRCGNCSRVHLHRGFDRCTRCGRDLAVEPSGTVAQLRAQNYLGARFDRARSRGDAPFRLRCEELTGQSSEPGKRLRRFKGITIPEPNEERHVRELRSKAEEIDFISVTTTMEVGVDIGALEAVYQANMPPQRFNYQQRVGRAGRRGQAFAAVITVCRSRSHDLHYFRNPLRITGDRPPPPFLTTGLLDIPSRLLRKFWMAAAFDRLRRSAGLGWAGDEVRPPDIHGEFIYCSEFFHPDHGWAERVAEALAATDERRRELALILAQAAGVPATRLLDLVDVASLQASLESMREEFEHRRIGLASAMAERGLIPLYGLPTRSRNLYVGLTTERRGVQNQPLWDTIDRDQDVALYEFAPGALLVRDKRRHLSVGFTGELPPPSPIPSENVIEPYDGWAREDFGLGFCEACGSWEKDLASARSCSACGSPISAEAYRRCVSPAGYRTDFRPRDEEGPTVGRRDLTLGSVGAHPETREVRNLRLQFEERAQIHKVNTGPLDAAGQAGAFLFEERTDRFGGDWRPKIGDDRKRFVKISNQAVVPILVNDDPARWPAMPDAGPGGSAWLASTKITNALHVTPVELSPLLRIAEVDSGTFFGGRTEELTSVRASAVSATQILVMRAALDLDVAPEEFEALAPRAFGSGAAARPFLQLADALVNGSGFCRHLHLAGSQSLDAMISSILDLGMGPNQPPAWPASALMDEEHRKTCDQSCYRCLQRYGNRSLHGLLDWRLGLSYIRAMADPTFVCGLDGRFESYAELRDWRDLASRYVNDVRAYIPGARTDLVGRLRLPAFTYNAGKDRWAVVVHPLWSRNGLASRLGISNGINFIDTFELARRPLAAVERLRN